MQKLQDENKNTAEGKYVDMKCGLCGYRYRIAKEDLFAIVEGKNPPFTFEEKCPYCFKPCGTWTATQDRPTAKKVTFVFAPVPRKEIWTVSVSMNK